MSYVPLKWLYDIVSKLVFDARNYIKASIRPKFEVADETIASSETLAVASLDEASFNNLTVDGRLKVRGMVDVSGDLDIGSAGVIDLIADGEINIGV